MPHGKITCIISYKTGYWVLSIPNNDADLFTDLPKETMIRPVPKRCDYSVMLERTGLYNEQDGLPGDGMGTPIGDFIGFVMQYNNSEAIRYIGHNFFGGCIHVSILTSDQTPSIHRSPTNSSLRARESRSLGDSHQPNVPTSNFAQCWFPVSYQF